MIVTNGNGKLLSLAASGGNEIAVAEAHGLPSLLSLWSPRFGMVKDHFGGGWMMSVTA